MEKTKVEIMSSSSFETQNCAVGSGWAFFIFRERRCALSLDFRSFGLSVLDEVRSKVDLHGESYVWTPIWWSSDNSKR